MALFCTNNARFLVKFSILLSFITQLELAVSWTAWRGQDEPETKSEGIAHFSFERSPCLGFCPVFIATVYPDNRLRLEAIRFITFSGEKLLTLDDKTYLQLNAAVNRLAKSGLQDPKECPQYRTDYPSFTGYIEDSRGSRRAFSHYFGCKGFEGEEMLRAFDKDVISILGLRQYFKQSR